MAKKSNISTLLVKLTNIMANMIYLSCFLLIGCIPLLTVGTSTTALYYAAMKSIRGEGSVAKNFFKSYKENLKQSVCVELIVLGMFCILYAMIRVSASVQGSWAVILQILFVILSFLALILISWLFPLLSRFDQTIFALFRNSLLIGFSNFPYTVAVTVLNLLPLLFFAIWPTGFIRLLLVILFFLPGLFARINSKILLRVFQKYTSEDEMETHKQFTSDEEE